MTEKATPKVVAVNDKSKTDPIIKEEFDKAELLTIFDEMIFSGEYSEETLIKNKLKVTFKARTADDVTAISRELDAGQYTLISTINEQRAFLNLVYSIITYSGKDFSKSSVEERKKQVGKLPAVVIAALSDALVKFDRKMDAACREGEANF